MSLFWWVKSSSGGWDRSRWRAGHRCHPCSTASPVPTFRMETARYSTLSVVCSAARPPPRGILVPSRKSIFCVGSCSREFISSGRWPASNDRSAVRAARSAVRAERFADWTDANVATASTRVLPAATRDEIVAESVIDRSLMAPPTAAPTTPRPARTPPPRRTPRDFWRWHERAFHTFRWHRLVQTGQLLLGTCDMYPDWLFRTHSSERWP